MNEFDIAAEVERVAALPAEERAEELERRVERLETELEATARALPSPSED